MPIRTASHIPTAGRFGDRTASRTDSARLDWLQTFAESIDRYTGPPSRWRVWSDEPGLVSLDMSGPSLRTAIDTAMAAMEGVDTA